MASNNKEFSTNLSCFCGQHRRRRRRAERERKWGGGKGQNQSDNTHRETHTTCHRLLCLYWQFHSAVLCPHHNWFIVARHNAEVQMVHVWECGVCEWDRGKETVCVCVGGGGSAKYNPWFRNNEKWKEVGKGGGETGNKEWDERSKSALKEPEKEGGRWKRGEWRRSKSSFFKVQYVQIVKFILQTNRVHLSPE